jgi:hypothetical protein
MGEAAVTYYADVWGRPDWASQRWSCKAEGYKVSTILTRESQQSVTKLCRPAEGFDAGCH